MAKEGGWAGLFGLLGAAVRYGNNVILTRVLGAKLFGLYALANTVVTVVAVPAGLGLPTSLVHFVAASAGTSQWGRLRWFVRAALALASYASLVGTVVVLLLSPWASERLFRKDGLLLPLAGLALALPFLVLYLVCAGGLQGLKAIRAKVFIERIAHPLIFTVLLLAGGFYFRNLEYVLVCFLLGAIGVFALSATWFRRRMKEVPPAEGPEKPRWRELFSFSMPVLFMNLLSYFVLQSDILVMGYFRPAAEVGIYTIASRLAQGVSLPTDALGASLAPNFSSLMGQGDFAGLRKLFHTSARWIFLAGTGVGLGLILAGRPILHVFGKDFADGYVALCLLCAGQMVSAAFGANGTLITMTGHPKVNLVNSFALGLGNLGLGLLLVPRFGGIGAAGAAAASLMIVNVARATEIGVILKMGPWDRTIRKPMAAFALAAIAGLGSLWWLSNLTLPGIPDWLVPLPATVIGLGLLAALWRFLGPVAEDLDMVKKAIRRATGVMGSNR